MLRENILLMILKKMKLLELFMKNNCQKKKIENSLELKK